MHTEEDRRRRSIRLPEYDYASPGGYFVTICTAERACLLGTVEDGVFVPSRAGHIVAACWEEIPRHFSGVETDEFVVMPNHLHGVLLVMDKSAITPLQGEALAGHDGQLKDPDRASASPLQIRRLAGTRSGSLGAIIQSFKAVSTRRVNQLGRTPGATLCQRNYYEHIIRNETSLDEIREYIRYNPMKWADDEYNPAGKP